MRRVSFILRYILDMFLPGYLVPRLLQFDPLMFLREMATMLRAGLPLPEVIGQIAEGHRWWVRRKLNHMRSHVEEGQPLSMAMRALPYRWAPNLVVATVAAGEACGRLPELLDELTGDFERLYFMDRRLRVILIYPACVLLFALLVFYVLNWKVLPVMATFSQGADIEVPLLGRLFRDFWMWFGMPLTSVVALFIIHLLFTIRRPFRWGQNPIFGSWLSWRLPVVRGLNRALIEVRFARTLRVLLQAGLPMEEAMHLCEGVVADQESGRAIVKAARLIQNGIKPSEALQTLTFLSPAFLWFLAGSEHRGDFLDVTNAMADAAEERFLTQVEVVERLVEPASIIVVGVIVGLAVTGTYTMIFNIVRASGNI